VIRHQYDRPQHDDRGVIAVGELAGRRMTAEIEGDFVVFLIGARLNNKLEFARSLMDLGGRRGMKHMLDYLVAHPDKGLMAYEMGFPTIVQYWRSFEQLEAFAKDKDDPHLEVWRKYWRRVGRSGRTGIWHETYLVKDGQYEAVYGNMPAHGLGKAGRLVPVAEASSARERLGALPVS
jgi:fumigallin biosynthesis monooxygenase-like protein